MFKYDEGTGINYFLFTTIVQSFQTQYLQFNKMHFQSDFYAQDI